MATLNAPVLSDIDQLRDAVTFAKEDGVRMELSFVILEIEEAIVAFKKHPCADALQLLVARWARGAHTLEFARKKAKPLYA